MFILISFILIIFLIVLSAFWAGSEIALTSLSKFRIKKIIAVKKHLEKPLMRWLNTPYYYLTTILVGNTVTNMLLSFFATLLVIELFGLYVKKEFLEFATWLIVTVLILIFGEVTPKIFCRHYPEKTTLFSLPILSKITDFSRPFAMVVVNTIKWFFPKADLVPVSRLSVLTAEEAKNLINEVKSSGGLGHETSQILDRIMKLNELSVNKIMTSADKIEAVEQCDDEEIFVDKITETGRSRVPVYACHSTKISGFIHTKDLLWAWKENRHVMDESIIRPPYFISPDKKVYDLLKEFQTGKTHMAFVADALGNTLGIVTLEDILEEIIGEMIDEYDIEEGAEDKGSVSSSSSVDKPTGKQGK